MTSPITPTNPNQGLGLSSINLIPPDASGDPYTNLAVQHKKPFGIGSNNPEESVSTILNYWTQDTISPASRDEIANLVSPVNISLQLSEQGDPAQLQLDSFDPSQPAIPIIKALINISDESLKKGDLGGVSVSQHKTTGTAATTAPADQDDDSLLTTSDESDTPVSFIVQSGETGGTAGAAAGSTAGGGSAAGASAGASGAGTAGTQGAAASAGTGSSKTAAVTVHVPNKWLAANAFTTFLMTFMELARELIQVKIAQGKIETASMAQIVALAQDTAAAIMDSAKLQQTLHIVAAVGAGVSLAGSVISLAGTAKESLSEEPEPSQKGQEEYKQNKAEEEYNNPKTRVELEEQWSINRTRPGQAESTRATDAEIDDYVRANHSKDVDVNDSKALAKYVKVNEDQLHASWKKDQLIKTARDNINPSELVNSKGHTAEEVRAINARHDSRIRTYATVSQAAGSLGTLVSESVQAAEQVPIATLEGLKELLQAYRQIAAHTLENTTDIFKSNTELIAQLLQTLTQMRQSIAQAVSASLSAH